MPTPPVIARTPLLTVAPSPPAGASPNDLWWSVITGTLYIFYYDGAEYQWVIVVPETGGAPSPGGPITGVFAGFGLTGGGETGNVTLNVDPGVVATPQYDPITTLTAGGTYHASATDVVLSVEPAAPAPSGIILPVAPTKGRRVKIFDGKGIAAANNITITPNEAVNINGAANLVLVANWQSVSLIWTGSIWKTY